MKKHHVNHQLLMRLPSRRMLRAKRRSSKKIFVGISAVAAIAITLAGIVGSKPTSSTLAASSQMQLDEVALKTPVEVGLFGGADAIRWGSENITSAGAGAQVADAANPEAKLVLSGSAAQLVGQSAGPLGVLPAGLQLIHPVTARRITSPYGWRNNPTGAGTQIHIGQDYAIACGSPVYATEAGEVVQSAWAGHSGMRVTIDHGSNVRTGYSHNSKLIAKVGETVKQGQLIALSGTTGNSTGCHVHFEVIIDGRWNDPRNFLPTIPGQPNPMIDSRRTTIAAEPIRNTGKPQTEASNGHDIEVQTPQKATAIPTIKPTQKSENSAEPTKEPQPSKPSALLTETSKAPKPTPTETKISPSPEKPSSSSSSGAEPPTLEPSDDDSTPEGTTPAKPTGNLANTKPAQQDFETAKDSAGD